MTHLDELRKRLRALYLAADETVVQDVTKWAELAILEARGEGRKTGLEEAAKLARERSTYYYEQMEGMGEPEFSNLDFAHEGMRVLARDIQRLAFHVSEQKESGQ